jgi:hypothetical protein
VSVYRVLRTTERRDIYLYSSSQNNMRGIPIRKKSGKDQKDDAEAMSSSSRGVALLVWHARAHGVPHLSNMRFLSEVASSLQWCEG